MNPVVHFEIPYLDQDRVSGFYTKVFGWKLTELGPGSGNYMLATTAESDAKPGAPSGAINGGFFPAKPDWPAQYPSIVIGVEDLLKTINLINHNGGEVLGDPVLLPGFGRYVSFKDTEGNRNSLIEPVTA
ncbi:MAG: VOC family protein [Flavobacteriales bacterium]|nr:VOC family protein [Flavobacteriales bacterium]